MLLNNIIKAYDLEMVTLLNKTHVGFSLRKNTTAYFFSLLFSYVYYGSLKRLYITSQVVLRFLFLSD
jgi:hypothetical protein